MDLGCSIAGFMGLIRTYKNLHLRASLLCVLLLGAAPSFASSTGAMYAYAEMNDAELTEVLQRWGTLQSSDRRGLLVELKKRMQRSQTLRARVPVASEAHAPRLTVYIRVRQTMRFGAGIDNQVGNLPSGGMVVVRGSVNGIGNPQRSAREILDHMRGLMARAQPLPGPGFGGGFEQRQAFLQTSLQIDDRNAGDALK